VASRLAGVALGANSLMAASSWTVSASRLRSYGYRSAICLPISARFASRAAMMSGLSIPYMVRKDVVGDGGFIWCLRHNTAQVLSHPVVETRGRIPATVYVLVDTCPRLPGDRVIHPIDQECQRWHCPCQGELYEVGQADQAPGAQDQEAGRRPSGARGGT
jgi:hypothetical protein